LSSYFYVNPDRYGRFGHQTLRILTGLLYYQLTAIPILSPRYLYFCEKWNQYIDWNILDFCVSAASFTNILNLGLTFDSVGNRKYPFDSGAELFHLTEYLLRQDKTLIQFPFDQHPGILLRLLKKSDIRTQFQQVFQPFKSIRPFAKPYIAFHIRRGDCTASSHPQWYITDEIYNSLISYLLAEVPRRIPMIICTQGATHGLSSDIINDEISSGRLLISSTDQLFINDAEVEAFSFMLNSAFLFCSGSSFSQLAAVFGSPKISFDISRFPAFPGIDFTLSPDDLDPAQIAHRIFRKLNTLSTNSG